jgi:hypothetical protein
MGADQAHVAGHVSMLEHVPYQGPKNFLKPVESPHENNISEIFTSKA